MGIDVNGSRFLLYAKQSGVEYSRTMMIGRQGLHLTPERLTANLAEFGHAVDLEEAKRILTAEGGFAESFFRLLGAAEVSSLDVSGFESASYLHDLNLPITPDLKGLFTVVLDGGSLEHVFNFPVAIKNCMELVAVGGHYLSITPTSNFSGHGFYQFSPDLYYRVFCPENGFLIERMLLYEDHPLAPWYEVADPAKVKRRVTFVSPMPAYLAVMARKTEAVPILSRPPQQSDYSAAWSGQSWMSKTPCDAVAGTVKKPANLLSWTLRKAANYRAGLIFLYRMLRSFRRNLFGYPAWSFKPFDPHRRTPIGDR